MYLGEINHRGLSYKGEHTAIIDYDLFEAVQAKLAGSRNRVSAKPFTLIRDDAVGNANFEETAWWWTQSGRIGLR